MKKKFEVNQFTVEASEQKNTQGTQQKCLIFNQSLNQKLINHNQLQNSILIKLRNSASQKPSFEQLMFLQQQKKHLWELLALKEQTIEKLQNKITQMQSQKKQCQIQVFKRDQIIKSLQQRERRLEKEVRRVTEIRQNIIEELNCLKMSFRQQKQHLVYESIKSKQLQQKCVQSNQTLLNRKKDLYDQNCSLIRQNRQLEQRNKILKQNLDQVLKQLRDIKVNVVERFNLLNSDSQDLKNKQNMNQNLNQNICVNQSFQKENSNRNSIRKRNSSQVISVKKISAKKTIKQKQNQFSQPKIPHVSERKSLDKKIIQLRQLSYR